MKNPPFILINIILIFAFLGTWGLVQNEFTNGDICPKIMGVPACYIIMGIIITAFITNFMKSEQARMLFLLVVVTALSIAIFGSLGEIVGFSKCPRTSGGIPMCFISFGIFVSLLILKLVKTEPE